MVVALAPGEFLLRLLVAMLLGLGIGLEREYRSDTPRAAGMRTLALVAMGSALFTLISAYGFAAFRVTTDPSRIAAQIVTGMGFLGAGAILLHKQAVRGLTTAAAIASSSSARAGEPGGGSISRPPGSGAVGQISPASTRS